MPRAPNHLPTVTITISTTPQVQKYLVDLLSTGLYGKNVAEAAERLIAQSVERKAVEGALPRRRRGR
jgi:hypothetical protein